MGLLEAYHQAKANPMNLSDKYGVVWSKTAHTKNAAGEALTTQIRVLYYKDGYGPTLSN